jgi:hypothetical protein
MPKRTERKRRTAETGFRAGRGGKLGGVREPAMRVTSHLTRPPTEAASAGAALGADHPLARTLDRLGLLLKQSAAVGALLLTASVAGVAGVPDVSALIVAAAVVQVALALGLLIVAAQERERARELIIDGRGHLPLAAVERERRRLLSADCRHRLARSVERARESAESSRWLTRSSRPLFRPHVVAAVGAQLADIAALLRRDEVDAAGVALMWRLLCDGASPLYGDDVAPLREALDLVRRRLER